MLNIAWGFLRKRRWLRCSLMGAVFIYVAGYWIFYCSTEGCTHPVDWAFHMKDEAQAAWALVIGTILALYVTERSASRREREAEAKRKVKERAETLQFVIQRLLVMDGLKTIALKNSHVLNQITWWTKDESEKAQGLLEGFTRFGSKDYDDLTPPSDLDPGIVEAGVLLQLHLRNFFGEWQWRVRTNVLEPNKERPKEQIVISLDGNRTLLEATKRAATDLALAADEFHRKCEAYEKELLASYQRSSG